MRSFLNNLPITFLFCLKLILEVVAERDRGYNPIAKIISTHLGSVFYDGDAILFSGVTSDPVRGSISKTRSPTQRTRSLIDRRDHLPPDSVDFELQWLEGTTADKATLQRLQLLKADHLINQGRSGEAEQILEQVQSRAEHPASSARANQRLNDLQNNRGGN